MQTPNLEFPITVFFPQILMNNFKYNLRPMMLSYSKSNLYLLCQEASTDHHCSFRINQGLRYFKPKANFYAPAKTGLFTDYSYL